MGNIAYFEVPADDLKRARNFYSKVLGWSIKKTKMPGTQDDYYSITTGKAKLVKGMGVLNMGGLTKRMMPNQQIVNYTQVEKIEKIAQKAIASGGKIILDIMPVPTVGKIAVVQDSEGNAIGIWEAEVKKAKRR